MTDHRNVKMTLAAREVKDRALIEEILKMTAVCTVAMHDEPYPYVVPMNYGFEWNDELTFYLHMPRRGLRLELLRKDPRVTLTTYTFLDRIGYKPYRGHDHDFRSVFVFGTADLLDPTENPEEFLHAAQVFCNYNKRYDIVEITKPMRALYMLRVKADIVRCKADYPISTLEEVPIPPLEPLDGE